MKMRKLFCSFILQICNYRLEIPVERDTKCVITVFAFSVASHPSRG